MSWRRFLVLLRGLGPWSALAWTLGSKGDKGGNGAVRVLEDPEEIEQHYRQLFGAPPKPQPPRAAS